MLICRLFSFSLPMLSSFGFVAPGIAQDREPASVISAVPMSASEAPSNDNRQAVVSGVLANGFTYLILPRRGKDTGVAILMRVSGGFLAEQRPTERGVAHLIEHLVFLSPTNVAPNEYRRFKQVGFPLTLPEPAGGSTSWRESDYYVVSRTNKPDDLDSLASLFREVSESLTFRSDAIENSRADVLREMADKKLGNDIFASYVAAVAPKSANDLIDAQNSDGVPSADANTIRQLYNRIYRPENTTFVMVGDVDPVATVTMLQNRFGNWQAVGPAAPTKTVTSPDLKIAVSKSYSARPYGRNTTLITSTAIMYKPPRTKQEQMTTRIMEMIAMRSANARMAQLYTDYPEGKYGFYIDNGTQDYHQMMFWDDFVPGRWREATTRLLRLNCSITTAGFTTDEVNQAAAAVLSDLSSSAATVADAPNSWLAKELADAKTSNRELIPPNEMLDFAKTFVSTNKVANLNSWWRTKWSAGRHHLRVESPELAMSKNAIGDINTVVDSLGLDQSCKF